MIFEVLIVLLMQTRPTLNEGSSSGRSFGLSSTYAQLPEDFWDFSSSCEEENQPVEDTTESAQLPEDFFCELSSSDDEQLYPDNPVCKLRFSSGSEQPSEESAQDSGSGQDSDFSFGFSCSDCGVEIPDDQPEEIHEQPQQRHMEELNSTDLLDIAKADYHLDQIIRRTLSPAKLLRQKQVYIYICIFFV
jgi:hypothetical protein